MHSTGHWAAEMRSGLLVAAPRRAPHATRDHVRLHSGVARRGGFVVTRGRGAWLVGLALSAGWTLKPPLRHEQCRAWCPCKGRWRGLLLVSSRVGGAVDVTLSLALMVFLGVKMAHDSESPFLVFYHTCVGYG